MRIGTAGIIAITVLAFTRVHAQAPTAPDGSAQRAAIERLGFMVGRWRGEAWMQRGPQRVTTTMTETVQRKLGGAALLIEGRGVTPATGGGEERVVHDALAILSFDVQAGYTMRSCIASGYCGDFAVTLTDSIVSWSRDVPGGRVRNTARYTATTWTEIGEFSRDGTTWIRVMEIHLRKEN